MSTDRKLGIAILNQMSNWTLENSVKVKLRSPKDQNYIYCLRSPLILITDYNNPLLPNRKLLLTIDTTKDIITCKDLASSLITETENNLKAIQKVILFLIDMTLRSH